MSKWNKNCDIFEVQRTLHVLSMEPYVEYNIPDQQVVLIGVDSFMPLI